MLSTARWLLLDPLHHRTGVTRPEWDFRDLASNIAAFQFAVEHHYRYYQFYGNTLIAVVVAGVCASAKSSISASGFAQYAALLLLLAALFFVASRDALKKYYDRAASLVA